MIITTSGFGTTMKLKARVEIDSVFWWMINKKSDYFDNQLMKTGIWFGFLFFNSLVFYINDRFLDCCLITTVSGSCRD